MGLWQRRYRQGFFAHFSTRPLLPRADGIFARGALNLGPARNHFVGLMKQP
jgi:hypothetical protein